MSGTKGALTDIAAVGETRAECLREAGYSTISDVANASAAQIADVPMISLNTSRGLRHAAKELRGDPDTIQRKIATECDAPREEVAEAFAKLAYLGSPYSEKKRALREKFSDPDRESILWLERRSLARRFLLWEAGYCTIESVATASFRELAELTRFNQKRAKAEISAAKDGLIRLSRESQSKGSSEPAGFSMSACDECGDLFMLESELESHIQAVHAAPEGVERLISSPERPRVDPSKPVTKERALELLYEGIGPSAEFRPQQWEAIDRLANNKERLLIVERTGWGKSTVYFITTRLLRDRGAGPTLIVSPLLALMRDQIKNAEEQFGLEAITINSSNTAEWERAKQAVLGGTCDVLLISPERFANREFRTTVLNEMTQGFGMLVVDEAHCISNWGHDFRPDYRRMKRIVERLPENVPVAATTATANDRVVEDVTTQLPDLSAIRGSLVRDSLSIQTIDLGSRERRLAWLAENIPKTTGSGIIYCLTTRDVEQVAEWLAGQGLSVLPYHGSLGQQVRIEREQKLLANQVDALVATNALGMGFDKPDLGFVIHFQRPPNLIRYYQEIGRAGRDLEEATAILLSGEDDDAIARYFIETAFPPAEVFEKVLSAISQSQEPMRDRAILREADVRYGQVSKCTDILQVEGAIKRQDSGYSRTANPWNYDGQRFQQVTAARWAELERIQEFTETEDCLTQFVDDALDGDLGKPCGQCANCTGEGLPTEIQDQQLLRDAVRYYQKGDGFEISPRKQQHVRGGTRTRIPEEERIESGRALAIWDQPGWGSKVKDGKYEKGRFDDELVEAAERFIREEWEPSPDPAWIAAVPSTTNDGLVADFATRLGRRLDIPFVNCLEKVKRTQQQKELNNSYQKCWNVQGAFDADITVLSADVLLVDDVVGSRWTLTEAGRMLRTAGSGRVYPFALAMRRGG